MSYQGNERKSNRQRRGQQARNSPSSKLLNAAWPKPPTVPTRQSHIKSVNHDQFLESWKEWQDRASSSSPLVEDMDVDMQDVEETSSQKKSTAQISKSSASGVAKVEGDSSRATLRAKRVKVEESSSTRSTRSSKKKASRPVSPEVPPPLTSQPTQQTTPTTTKPTNASKNNNKALFIIIHLNRVEIGNVKGPATSPMKVYASKFMVQMECQATKKEVSFRVPCKSITSLDVSLNEKPYFIKLVSPVQYLNGKPITRKSQRPPEPESVNLYLGYEETVPEDVKEGLNDLFKERPDLWTKDADEKQEKKEEKEEDNLKEEKSENSSDENKVEGKENPKPTEPKNKENVVKDQKEGKKGPLTTVRKRVPNDTLKVVKAEDPNQTKIARRVENTYERRVKTLSHEAAHYQMVNAQQRMIIQSLENEASAKTRLCEERLRDKEVTSNEQVERLLADLSTERDLVKALQLQVQSLQTEKKLREILIESKNDSIRVCEQTIEEVRNTSSRLSTSVEEKHAERANMEETRQNLMQMQVSRQNLAAELESTRGQLEASRLLAETHQTQLETLETDKFAAEEELACLRTDFIGSQEELVNSREQLRALTQQLAQARDQHTSDLERMNTQLNMSTSQLEEVRSELNESRTEVSRAREISNTEQPKDWLIQRGEVTFTERIIGVGAWGNVKVGRFRGTEVAVKQIHLLILSAHNRRLFEREMAIASRCRHPCLVQFIGATNDDGQPIFVMELLDIDLRSLLGRQALSEADYLNIGHDVIRALAYLHQSKPTAIVHRDISSSNVLLHKAGSHWRGKLSDYGAANFVRLSMTRHPGGLLYSAPEAGGMEQTPKLDVYSFGILFCEMVTRELPVPEIRHEQINNIANTDYREFVINCIRHDVTKRLDSTQIIALFEGWIQSITSR